MKKALDLSNVQVAKVGKINLRTAKQMQSIYETPEGRFRKFRQLMRARDAKDSELRNVLTGAQCSKYQAKKEEMWQKMHTMRKMK
jgi:adenylate cyclase class IV